jgi:hypothetical protein
MLASLHVCAITDLSVLQCDAQPECFSRGKEGGRGEAQQHVVCFQATTSLYEGIEIYDNEQYCAIGTHLNKVYGLAFDGLVF